VTQAHEQMSRRRWLMPVLIASLAFNLLIIGAAGAMIYHHFSSGMSARMMARSAQDHPQARLGRPGLMLRAAWRTLRQMPRKRRQILRQQAREYRAQIRQAYREVARARDELARIVTAQRFDKQAYEQAMQRLRAADIRARQKVLDLMDAFLRALTPQERKLFGDNMKRAGRGWKWRRR